MKYFILRSALFVRAGMAERKRFQYLPKGQRDTGGIGWNCGFSRFARRLLMKPSILLSVCLVAVSPTAIPTAAQNNLPPEIREMARKVMMPVVYKVPGMEKVKVVQNLKYTSTDDPNVLMDVYLPPDAVSGEKRPAVIFIHGGAKTEYTAKDWGIYTTWGRLIAASGFVGVTFTHRLEYPNKSLESAAKDVRAAIDYARANADKYNVDKDRICLIAFSAGGPMLSLAMRGDMPYVRCLVGFYAFMDIQQSDYRKTESAETLKAFSPIAYLQKDAGQTPPIFIARAGRDEVPTMDDSIDRFVHEGLVKNIALTFMNHPQGVHAFDNQNDDERSREIIRSAIAFMRIHLSMNGDAPGKQ
jgi:acetyl esterase/lipase